MYELKSNFKHYKF